MKELETMPPEIDTTSEKQEYRARLIYFMAAMMTHHNFLLFLVPEEETPSVKNMADHSLKLLAVLLIARLAGTYDKEAMHDILSGLSPFFIDAMKTVEEGLQIPIQEDKESVSADKTSIEERERTLLFLTTARRALENGDDQQFNESVNQMLIALGIVPEELDKELKQFGKLATLLKFSLNEGLDDKTNDMTGFIQI